MGVTEGRGKAFGLETNIHKGSQIQILGGVPGCMTLSLVLHLPLDSEAYQEHVTNSFLLTKPQSVSHACI